MFSTFYVFPNTRNVVHHFLWMAKLHMSPNLGASKKQLSWFHPKQSHAGLVDYRLIAYVTFIEVIWNWRFADIQQTFSYYSWKSGRLRFYLHGCCGLIKTLDATLLNMDANIDRLVHRCTLLRMILPRLSWLLLATVRAGKEKVWE